MSAVNRNMTVESSRDSGFSLQTTASSHRIVVGQKLAFTCLWQTERLRPFRVAWIRFIWRACEMTGRRSLFVLLLLPVSFLVGCASSHPMLVSNPVFLPSGTQHSAWERAVDVLHDFHFPIARENRLDGVIETDYRVGSSLLELSHRDSVGATNRLESTLQSIRRKAKVDLTPVEGGFLVGVEAYKEQEDLRGSAENTAGGATFRDSQPLERNLKTVVGQNGRSGWIPLGRDTDLEQAILGELQR